MNKTGGVWMSDHLRAHHDGRAIGSHGHLPAHLLDSDEAEGKMLWGTIRDPWSWYLSWYSHQKPDLDKCGGSSEFKDVLMETLRRDPEHYPENSAVMWSISGASADARNDTYIDGQGGLFTWTFFYMFGDQVKTFVDINRMHEGVEALFGSSPDSDQPTNIRNLDLPSSPEEMYDDEMIEAVYRADSHLIETLGYEGPFSVLKEPVVSID
ncbi:MAG: hypothetical protein ACYTFU_06965 [Planctomycetota bacterium]